MDFYLQYIRFRTDLAVNAKSCVNGNFLFHIFIFYNIQVVTRQEIFSIIEHVCNRKPGAELLRMINYRNG